ncbi:fucose 4-O-acetylase [Paenibacillus sp. P96]|uniref:Fucose 4-O-acetylase n=1 Tax=Paenibacillus zeirhizosphaerae TaxID=2987519 RepID=A0ABT9FKI7_9BACL|nr:fucose 4-O-acetylase [Paenibacillus sp. P96]MDP4095238.1 fucose 4-O-acetylase [Paenibacillus sp. P96]
MSGVSAQSKDSFFLNLRFLLIVCVFIANALEPLIGINTWADRWYTWIFMFHMPLFVWVTGYFARLSLKGEAGGRVLLQIMAQYIIFQSLYSLLDKAFFHVQGLHHSFFAPYLLLWFLASHFCWRLLLLAMRRLPPAVQLTASITLGGLAGYLPFEGTWLSISRTFIFLPFFILGYHMTYEKISLLLTPRIRSAAIAMSLLLFAGAVWVSAHLQTGWLYGSMTYTELGHGEWYAGFYRIGIYMLQLTASAAFLGLVPLTSGWLSRMGSRTLYVFLLHGFIIRGAAASGIYTYVHTTYGIAFIMITACLLTVLLSLPGIKRAAHLFIEPNVDWLLMLFNRLAEFCPKSWRTASRIETKS